MDNRENYQMDEETIDLKELLLYILRKWRVLIVAGLIGVALGAGVQMMKPEKTFESLDKGALHLMEIEQYARYQQLCKEQLKKEEDSVYMNMDPQQVYSGQKVYHISAYESDMNRIGKGYSAVALDPQIYHELAEVSGLECTGREIQELVSVGFARYEKNKTDMPSDETKRSGNLTISVKAPNSDALSSMMDYLDEQIEETHAYFAANVPEFTYELVSDTLDVGYNAGVLTARSISAEVLSGYIKEMAELEKRLTEDDWLYYNVVYGNGEKSVQPAEKGFAGLKWGIVVGILFGGLMVVFYGVKFLLDGHIKNVDELKQRYGLPLMALVSAVKSERKRCFIDQLLETRLEYNTDEYLRTSIDVMKKNRIQICGDMKNAEIAAKLNLFSEDTDVVICDRFAVDEHAQRAVRDTDGVVLFVQLWKTKHTELLRELETCRRLGQNVIGVVVIG